MLIQRHQSGIVAFNKRYLFLAIGAVGLTVLSSCGDPGRPEPPLPPGTPVSGNVATADILNVVYWPQGEGDPHVIAVKDTGESITYRSAVPPGDYTVYAYITGARAKIGEVTVGEDEAHVDIPDALEWEEARDEISGAPKAETD